MITVVRSCTIKPLDASVEPAVGHVHTFLSVVVGAWVGRTFIERHYDICSDNPLHIHHIFRGKKVLRAIYMTLKLNPFLGYLTTLSQGIHLIAATICEDGLVPTIELVQPASLMQYVSTGAKKQMVGIAQNDVGANIIFELPLVDCFYRPGRSYRHKNGCRNGTMISGNEPCSGFGAGIFGLELK